MLYLTDKSTHKLMYEPKDFKFLTPKIQVNPDDLSDRMLRSRTYHLMCTPARCIELVKGILEKRKALHGADTTKWLGAFKKPIFLWEPMEGSCRPGELKSFCEALKYVDIFSPNSHELASLFNDPRDVKPGSLDGEQFLYACRTILTLGFGIRPSAIIVRMGADGCFVHTMNRYFNISPWHSKKTFKQSFDVTGGGNAFMGGFAAGLIARDELLKKGFTEFEIAAIYGSVASSFAIEQVGMPKLTHRPDGTELWNGQSVQERLATMRKRILKELGVPRPMSEAKMRKQSLFHPDGASHKGEL